MRLGWLPLLGLVGACSGSQRSESRPPSKPAYAWTRPQACAIDEVREFYCDELVPLRSSLPAPAPYENCPASTASHTGLHEPIAPVAVFDGEYTAYIRARMPPGNSCCFSFCGPIRVVAPEQALPQAGCAQPPVFREQYCLREPESGTSRPFGAGFDRCPAAIVPPAGAVFEVPRAALFDQRASVQKRTQGLYECCYGWCSKVPAATGLEKQR